MREIEFRGKRLDNNEWIYGDLLQPTELCYIYEISDKNTIDGSRFDVEPETIGQYTGLKDKNGKKIFEGDIVRRVSYAFSNDEFGNKGFYEDIFEIKYQGRAFKERWIKTKEIEMPKDFKGSFEEIIGNTTDNPKLLEEEV